jgi:hypothetical protein
VAWLLGVTADAEGARPPGGVACCFPVLVPSSSSWRCGGLVRVVRVVCEEAAGRLVCAPPGLAAAVFMIPKTFYCAGSNKSS